jgi:hypothetical protein
MEDLLRYVHYSHENTPMVRLEQAQNIASTVAGDEPALPILVEVSDDEVCIKGMTIFKKDFKEMIKSLWKQVQVNLSIVLCGLDTAWIDQKVQANEIKDDMGNEEVVPPV